MYQPSYELRGPNGKAWQLQDQYGETWQPQGQYGEAWQPQGQYGETWQPQGPNGEAWQLQDQYGETWQPQGQYGEAWQPQGPNGEAWQPQGQYGEARQLQDPDVEARQFVGPNGEMWQLQGPNGEALHPHGPNREFWQPKSLEGEAWQLQVPHGEARQFVGPSGRVWQLQGPNGEVWQPQGTKEEARQPRRWEGYPPRGEPQTLQKAPERPTLQPPEGDAPERKKAQDFKDLIITADVNLPRLAVASSSPYAHRPKKSSQGLPNLGNTCYMNAVLQCLYHTRDLTEYFCRDMSWASDINEKSTTKGEVALAYGETIKAMERGKGKKDALRTLQSVCGDYDLRFQGHDQKEAHDLLRCLLQWLHQDLAKGNLECACAKKKASIRKQRHLRLQEASSRRVLPRQDDYAAAAREPPSQLLCRGCGVPMEAGSVVSDLFVGIHESTIICLTSGTILSRTHERYTSLTLPVNPRGETHLVDALKRYYRSQDIFQHCAYCQREHLCHRETRILSLPRILLLHFSREVPDLHERRVSRVSFPEEGLGLDDYLATELLPRGRRYSLSSVCNRHGSETRAHYTAYCRNRRQNPLLPQSWHLFDDDHVEPARSFRAPYEAHILFYECLND